MAMSLEHRKHKVNLIFDLEDRYARDRVLGLAHPRPMEPIHFYLTGIVGTEGEHEYFDAPWEMVVVRNPSGYYLFFDQVRWSTGELRRVDLVRDTYVVRIESAFYQPLEREIPVPALPYSVDLEPNYAYPFPKSAMPSSGYSPTLLRGSVSQPNGSGIAGATIQVKGDAQPQPSHTRDRGVKQRPNTYITNNTGQWVLIFPDAYRGGDITLQIELPDGGGRREVANVGPIEPGVENTRAPIILQE